MDKLKVVLATQNLHKLKEITKILESLPIEWVCLKEFSHIQVAEETGFSFRENALLKAHAIAQQTGFVTVADDSGFSVDALEGRPGIYSARYAGEGASDAENLKKVLKEYLSSPMKNINKKSSFICALAWVDLQKNIQKVFEGQVQGEIIEVPVGENGFGYDPLFYFPSLNKTFAQLSAEEKNKLSHRAIAFLRLKRYLLETYF
ncbi:MAG: RdgB/HAM1 family non-canonical purine NTP pyrophosphatase [Deltaproteobacteria bacterium]|nr:RdgB/HAM1 family non-canonical purine NTP pyrophosphatase [Deltaproteobacteria bacterium]